ncbi:MAG: leucyl/phenylalanyl-tRNA--protein transferase [Flavobacteriaceae bacterium]|nr:leucyl/phenylalanyl-tRNA--protein transferase [Flavobacteriaceae bacterium]|tara:strand:- start:112437 stop:113069 length:633 start_codon:yes stop_codon:yes gene_type:complete
MIWLTEEIKFPPYNKTTKHGIIALGGDLSSERLIHAYENGIFPWFSEFDPIIWYCPHSRMVLFPEEIKISKSMKKVMKKGEFRITQDLAFPDVIYQCKSIERKDEGDTWITDDMERAYIEMHHRGYASSVEVWQGDELVGGLYGVVVNGVFCGESMFSKVANASKLAFIHLAQCEKYRLIDCQIYTKHLASLGAREIERDEFLTILKSQS